VPKLEEAFARAGLTHQGRFIPDAAALVDCECGLTVSLQDADRRDGTISTRYLCSGCGTEIMRVTEKPDGKFTFGGPFGFTVIDPQELA